MTPFCRYHDTRIMKKHPGIIRNNGQADANGPHTYIKIYRPTLNRIREGQKGRPIEHTYKHHKEEEEDWHSHHIKGKRAWSCRSA